MSGEELQTIVQKQRELSPALIARARRAVNSAAKLSSMRKRNVDGFANAEEEQKSATNAW
jgi:hypothetical protein